MLKRPEKKQATHKAWMLEVKVWLLNLVEGVKSVEGGRREKGGYLTAKVEVERVKHGLVRML